MSDKAMRLPVTVLSGFLGAGKTTVLNHILDEEQLLAGKAFWQTLNDPFPHWE